MPFTMFRLFRPFILLLSALFICSSPRAQYAFDGPKEITHMFYNINDTDEADMDGDGLKDIVLSTYGSYTRLVVKFQVSPGQFSDSLVFRHLPGFSGFSLYDVENDGDVDILLQTSESNSNPLANNSLLILPNNGDGSFAAPVVNHFIDSFGSIRFFDWDLDGLVDVLVEIDDVIYLHKQTPSLVLESGQAIYQTNNLTNFACTDLDNDGDWDLVGVYYDSASSLRNHFYALQNAPLIFENLVVIAETTNWLRDMEFTDLNNDGYTDYIMTCGGGNGLFIFVNDGVGNLIYSGGSAGIWEGDFDMVDLDGNEYPDISVFEIDGDEITFGFNDGSTISWQVFVTSIFCTRGRTTDMDGDNDLDFYYGFYNSSGVQNLNYGMNPGDLGQVDWTEMNASYYPVFSAAKVMDYNNDDLMDLVVNINSSAVAIENNGDGSFDDEFPLPGTYGNTGSRLTVTDLNNDGLQDMISLKLNANNNDQNFKTMIRSDVGFYYSSDWVLDSYYIWKYAVGDINADGFPDLVFQEFPNYDVRRSLNQGDGSFGYPSLVASLNGTANLTFVDANADGYPDILVDESAQAKIYLNNTTGGFTSGLTFTSSTEVMLAGVDWDNDGLEDIFSTDGSLFWRKNLGDAVYADRVALTDGLAVGAYQYHDMNADGFMDMVIANLTTNPDSTAIYVLQNNGGTDLNVFPVAKIPGADDIVYVGDMDSDGLPDLTLYDYTYREYYWWKNLGQACESFQPEISSDQVFCPGDSITIQVSGADQVNWEYDYYGADYVVSPDSTVVYRAYVRSDIGCVDTLSVSAVLAEIEDVQVLMNGPTLSASGGSNILWYEVGNPEILSSNTTYQPAQNGFYFFTSQSADGCPQQSDTLEFLYFGLSENSPFTMTLFPNPGSEILNIGHAEPSAISGIFISDMQGRRIWTAENIQASGTYVLPKSIAPASYIVNVLHTDGTVVRRVWMRE